MTLSTVDLFSGLGGFSEGARQAGACVLFAANHWGQACRWHEMNHPDVVHEQQDLRQFDFRRLPDLSEGLLLAAPACQGHSSNSQPARAGTGGSHAPDAERARARCALQRSTVYAVIAAAEEARPRTIVVENVVNFVTRWALFRGWVGMLETLGYAVRVHVLDARSYGSAQARQRAIVTAHLGGPVELADQWGGAAALTLRDVLDLDPDHPDHRWSDLRAKSARMLSRMRKAQAEAGPVCVWNNVSEAAGRSLDGAAPTLTTKSGSQLYLLDHDRGRVLNSRELARIQGFPESYRLPESRALAGALIGNAIDVRLARGVVAQVLEQVA